jgi:hypothetical protein
MFAAKAILVISIGYSLPSKFPSGTAVGRIYAKPAFQNQLFALPGALSFNSFRIASQRSVLKIPQGQGWARNLAPAAGVIFPAFTRSMTTFVSREATMPWPHIVVICWTSSSGSSDLCPWTPRDRKAVCGLRSISLAILTISSIRPLMTMEIPVSASLSFFRTDRTASLSEKQPATP